ncbi:MAG: NADH-quinone oxidoreductase subunit NuoH [Nitrospirae bacterium]|nr:NADH-quinone oxidoreductase subunit NuoH [Nitrospirota bacterium]MBF0540088.1 NADH-quinone oxidoreductase subunit NuoH [Nitrospirota bacterium]
MINETLYNLIITIIKIIVVLSVAMLHVAFAVYFERKTIGHMQRRLGPMEVGPHGILQSFADVIKLFFKEDLVPASADKPLFYIAPVIGIAATMVSLSVVPFFNGFAIANIKVGLLFLFAMSSLGAYAVILAGWASNSKYSFLGGMRSSAQVISYEVSMGLSLVGVMIMAESLNLNDIVAAQQNFPTRLYIIPQFIGFVVFVLSAMAETNRVPFDLPEAEQELVAGYFTEYSGMRFALFFLAEYIGMLVMSSVAVVCFLGGWGLPGFIYSIFSGSSIFISILEVICFLFKLYMCMFFYYWVRSTLPRYRYDQLMSLGWKILIPVSVFNILITGTIKMLVQ